MATTREVLETELAKIIAQQDIVNKQIENSDYNIAGLISQKTRHMDKWDALEEKRVSLQAELETVIAAEEAGV
mgnify:CR=1 FL=1